MAEQLGLKYGNWVYNTTDTSKDGNGLPTTIDKGTIYVAKTSDGHAKMYVDSPNGERLSVSGGEGSYFATCTTATATAEKVITCAGMSAPQNGTMITVKFNPVFDSSINNIKLKINGTVYDVYNATLNSNSDMGLRSNLVTFVYDNVNSRFEIMNNPGWNTVSAHPIMPGQDRKKHYLIATSANYGGPEQTGPTIGNSDLWVTSADELIYNYDSGNKTAKSTAPYLNGNGNLVMPTRYSCITWGGNLDTNAEGMRLDISSESIHWYGYSEYNDAWGSWMLYNNGSNLRLMNENTGYERMVIGNEYTKLYENTELAFGDLEITDGYLDVYGDITSYGNLYHQGGIRVPRVYSGTAAPSDSVGQNGDIYIMYS